MAVGGPGQRPTPAADAGVSHKEGETTPGAGDEPEERPFINGGPLLDDIEGWSENNASASEAVVKAERHDSHLSIERLQDRTVKHVVDAHGAVTEKTSVLKHQDADRPEGTTKKNE